jgi:protein-disulfide isomerase
MLRSFVRARRATVMTALVASLAMALPGLAAGQDDTASPTPELTWAPLVTPPPVTAPYVVTPTDQADGYALGAPDAPVQVEVFEDFQCPYCQRFTLQVEPQLVDQYVVPGKVRFIYRTLAFLGDESQWAAVAADLAADQNKFWPFHDYLFTNNLGENVGSFSLDRLLQMAELSGLDMDQFRAGMTLDNARQRFAAIQADGRQRAGELGISATPTVVVDGVVMDSPDFDTVSAAIDAAVAKAADEAPAATADDAAASPTDSGQTG